MPKSKKKWIVLGLIIAVIIGAYLTIFGIPYDPYTTLDDFTYPQLDKWEFETESASTPGAPTVPCPRIRSSSVGIANNQLILIAQGNMRAKATRLEDLKEKDLKIKAEFTYGAPSHAGGQTGIVEFHLGNKIIFSDQINVFTADEPRIQTKPYLIYFIKDFIDPNLIHIEVNGAFIGSELVEDEIAQLKFVTYGLKSLCHTQPTATLRVDYINEKNYESCNLDEDEIIFTDRFYQGSEITIKDLSHAQRKFCPTERPAIRRNIETGGERANIRGTVYEALRRGEPITVPEGWVFEIPYGVDYIEGMGDSNCPAGEYELVKNHISQGCIKVVFELEDTVEFVNQHIIITIGEKEVFFDNNLDFNNRQIISSKPEYLGSNDKSQPIQEPSEWEVTVIYAGTTHKLNYNEIIDLDNFFQLQAFPEAQFKEGEVQDDYINHFKLIIKNDDIFELRTIKEDPIKHWVFFGEERNIEFTVINNFDDWEECGLQIRKITGKLLGEAPPEMLDIPFKKGETTDIINVDSSLYEELNYQILLWYKIGDKTFFDNDVILKSYEIVDEIPTEIQVIEVEVIVEIEEPTLLPWYTKLWIWIKGLFGG